MSNLKTKVLGYAASTLVGLAAGMGQQISQENLSPTDEDSPSNSDNGMSSGKVSICTRMGGRKEPCQ